MSKTGIATYVLIIEATLGLLGVEPAVGSIEAIVVGVITAVSLGMVLYHQIVDRGLVAGLLRR